MWLSISDQWQLRPYLAPFSRNKSVADRRTDDGQTMTTMPIARLLLNYGRLKGGHTKPYRGWGFVFIALQGVSALTVGLWVGTQNEDKREAPKSFLLTYLLTFISHSGWCADVRYSRGPCPILSDTVWNSNNNRNTTGRFLISPDIYNLHTRQPYSLILCFSLCPVVFCQTTGLWQSLLSAAFICSFSLHVLLTRIRDFAWHFISAFVLLLCPKCSLRAKAATAFSAS